MPQQEIILLFQAFVAFVGDVPSAAERWQDDRFYGSQFLNGCNPDTIKRCIELPSKFPVTQELVGNLLDESDTLQKAMEVGFSPYFVVFTLIETICPKTCLKRVAKRAKRPLPFDLYRLKTYLF